MPMEISERLYFRQRLSVVSRHDGLWLSIETQRQNKRRQTHTHTRTNDYELHSQLVIEVINYASVKNKTPG